MLLALALPLATGQEFVALTLLSAGAFGLALIAQRWQRGGVRVTSYLLQLYACVTLVLELYSTKDAEPSVVSALAAGALACIGLSHYRWARRHAPPATSFVFSRFDQEDRSAVLLLLGALVSGFFTLRVGIYQGLIAAGITGPGAFGCYQSVLINLSAIVLMVLALLRRNRELRNVAVLVTIVGGCKVFFGDMLAARGLPLVLSVFSFGLAAAIGSVVLGRWQRQTVEAAPDTPAAEPREVKEA
jgi:xanthine/uracil permease